MPRAYEALRDKLASSGLPMAKAKMRAAMIYNANRKRGARPVTRNPSTKDRS